MVKSTLTYRKRVRLLPWIIVLVGFVVYWLAVSETLRLRKEVKLMENEAQAAETAPQRLNNIMKKLADMDDIAGNKAEEIVSDPLLELSSKQAAENNAILSEYQPVHIFNYGNHRVETRIISFEAPFIPCLKVLYNIEKSYRYGKIVSVNYFTRTDYKTSKKHLTMQVLIQNIQNEPSMTEKLDTQGQ